LITHLNGYLVEKNPTSIVVECNGVGYFVSISLTTFSSLGSVDKVKIYTKFVVREDAQLLYGFSTIEERSMFEQLVSVSGIGPNTAMIMLSSLSAQQIAVAIQTEDVKTIQSVKGIGAKTAQRVIVDLKDKVLKMNFSTDNELLKNNTNRFDALNALVSLGFDRRLAEKAVNKVTQQDDSVEKIIKESLKIL